jgi:hypothetical protein
METLPSQTLTLCVVAHNKAGAYEAFKEIRNADPHTKFAGAFPNGESLPRRFDVLVTTCPIDTKD